MAETGKSGLSVRPTTMSTPPPNWSHLDRRRWTLTMDGEVLLSTATSPHERLVVGPLGDSTNNSPNQKKPKKAVAATAQMRVLSGRDEWSNEPWIRARIRAVIGNLTLGATFRARRVRLMPARTLFNTGRDDWSRGSGRSRDSWRFRDSGQVGLGCLCC